MSNIECLRQSNFASREIAATRGMMNGDSQITQCGASRWLHLCASVLVFSIITLCGNSAFAGTPHSQGRSCGSPGQSACPASPPLITPWSYQADSPQVLGNPQFNSIGGWQTAVTYWFQSVVGVCSVSYGGMFDPHGESYGDGILLGATLDYPATYIDYTTSAPPCSNQNNGTVYVDEFRSDNCPVGLTETYQSSPLVGPYCTLPPATDTPLKQIGSCPTCSGVTAKGDPVNVSNGNTYLAETDYAGTGTNPLKFVRSYNSLSNYLLAYYQAARPGLSAVMGEAWSATYFQFLLPVSVTDSTTTYNTVYAYRPDGRVLTFNQYNGVYSPDGDVADSLLALTGGGWEYQAADDTIETYDTNGQLVSITPRGQAPLTISRPVAFEPPSSVADSFGHTLQFTYLTDSTGKERLNTVTDPAGKIFQYAYDGNGNLTSVTYPDTSTRKYAYSTGVGKNLLLTLTDEANAAYASWTYSTWGNQVLSFQHAGGVEAYSFSYTTNSGGAITSAMVIDPFNQSRTYGQQLVWGVNRTTTSSSACPGCGDDQTRVLDADGNITSRTDWNGNQTTYVYNTTNNTETSRTEAYGTGQARTITTTWDPNWRQQDLITEPNRTTGFTYDGKGNVLTKTITDTTVTPNVTRTWTYTYDSYGRMLTAKGPRTDLNSTTTYAYYTCTTGTQCGQVQTITDGLGNYISYTLDAMGNRTAIKTYDPSSMLHRTHTRVFNTLNELYQDVNAAGTSAVTTTYGYDNNGNQTSIAAPLSRNTVDQYDALNRLTQITDPNNGITKLGYDANDNLASVKDPRSLTTTYSHNGFGDVTKLVSPDTGTSSSTYDSGGNVKTTTDARSAVATYSYDALNRVTQVAYTDQTINFTYDGGTNGLGRLTGASDANHSMSWTYDGLGRVTGKGQINGTIAQSVGYGYTNGDLVSLVTPSGQTVTYTYNNHRISSIAVNGTTILSGSTYDPFGPATGWTWGNASAVSRAYDQDGNPHQIVTAAVTNGYTVDNASRITGLSDSGLASNSFTFGYDLLDRVTSGTSTALSRGYTYDANSNQLTTTGTVSFTDSIAPTNNHLSSTAGGIARTYAYDAAGNTTSYASNAYTFNQRGRMSKVLVGTNETDYIYNALGQLIRKSGAGGTTLLMYDEAGHLLGEYTAAGALIQETVWMDDTPVATLRPNGSTGCTSTVCIFYVHSDHLGTPRKVTRPSDNALMWRWDPDTFGSVAPNQNPGGVGIYLYNLRFPGQYSLNESGLYYNYYRDLDPQTGRYIESDPIGLNGGSFSTYAYAGGNPVGDSDPSGLLVRGGGWSDKEWSDIQRAEAKIRKELAKSCSCHKNGADGCIPCDLSESLLNRLDTMVVIYRSLNGDCGATPPVANPKGFALSRKAWKCGGCLASTIYHELLHTTGLLDPEAPELEDKCIGNLCEGSK